MNTGVYCIYYHERLIYIGSAAISFRKRWKQHINDLTKSRHPSRYLQNIFNKHGVAVLSFKILEFALPVDCIALEQIYLDSYFHEGLANTSPTAGSNFGVKKTHIQINAMRLRSKKMWENPEIREKIIKSKKGKPNGRKGIKFTNEHKANLKKNWNYSKPRWTQFAKDKRKENPPKKGTGQTGLEYTTYIKSRNKYRVNYTKFPIKRKQFTTLLEAYLYVYSQIAIYNKQYSVVRT